MYYYECIYYFVFLCITMYYYLFLCISVPPCNTVRVCKDLQTLTPTPLQTCSSDHLICFSLLTVPYILSVTPSSPPIDLYLYTSLPGSRAHRRAEGLAQSHGVCFVLLLLRLLLPSGGGASARCLKAKPHRKTWVWCGQAVSSCGTAKDDS